MASELVKTADQTAASAVSMPATYLPDVLSPALASTRSGTVKRRVYKFQVVWDPVRKKKNLSYDIRSHIIIAPYRGKSHSGLHVVKGEFPETSPLRRAVDACRAKGIPVITGYWKYWNNPLAILFHTHHMPSDIIDRYVAELKRDHEINIPVNDDKARQSIVLSYCAVELIIQFELAIPPEMLSSKSWIRFHNWTGAAGAIFLPQWFKPHIKVALQISKTQLTDLTPRDLNEAKLMAQEAKVGHRYILEVEGADSASQIILPKGVSSDLIEKELLQKPTHRLKDPQPEWQAKLRSLFACTKKVPENRLLEREYSDENEADNDLKDINIPIIRTWRKAA